MGFINLTLHDLVVKSLAYVGDIASDSRFGTGPSGESQSLAVGFINDGLMRLTTDWLGVDDEWVTWTVAPATAGGLGRRDYALPEGFRKVQSVYWNGYPLRVCNQEDINWYAPGNSYPSRYFIWNKGSKIILGPDPPYQAAPLKLLYWRRPQTLAQPTDEPEIPNEYRPALAFWAAAQMALGDNELAQYKELLSQYERLAETFREWVDDKHTEHPQVRNVTESGWFGSWGSR